MMKIIETLKGKKQETPPIWLMRQAGRYLPEYMKIRHQAGDFLTLCYTPEWASEVTLQPVDRFDLDAAIIFSDILVIPHALGQEVGFVKGEGPKLGALDIDALEFDIEFLQPVFKALELTRRALDPSKALIGFAGAPWTLACYMIEGQGSKEWEKARVFAYQNPSAFEKLIALLVDAIAEYLVRKVDAGANILQIFDSWSGVLPPYQFNRWVIEPTTEIIRRVRAQRPDIPIIGFPRGAGVKVFDYVRATKVDGVSLDTSVPLTQMIELQQECVVQGNLDPIALLAGGTEMVDQAQKILQALGDRPMIFNLGHGVNKETDPENVAKLVQTIRNFKA